jgi:hypothetical protein
MPWGPKAAGGSILYLPGSHACLGDAVDAVGAAIPILNVKIETRVSKTSLILFIISYPRFL